jgi:hypothetical protein
VRGKLLTAAVFALLLLISTTGVAAASPRFKTGLYTGTTSQHKPFSFYVRVTSCGHKSGLCLYTKIQPYLEMPCPSGNATNAYADPGPLIVPASGIVHETLTLFAKVTAYIKLTHDGHASGRFEATNTEGCTSGVVTFTAKRG